MYNLLGEEERPAHNFRSVVEPPVMAAAADDGAPTPNPSAAALDHLRTLAAALPSQLWKLLAGLVPDPHRLLSLPTRLLSGGGRPRLKPGFPLPLYSNSPHSARVLTGTRKLTDALEDVVGHILSRLRQIDKSLSFWSARAEGTDAQKIYFMMFERGPRAFVGTTTQLVQGFATQKSSLQDISQMATTSIYDKITALDTVQNILASFLAQLYVDVEKVGESVRNESDDSLVPLLVIMDSLFSKLESALNNMNTNHNIIDSSIEGDRALRLQFDKVHLVDKESTQWTSGEQEDAVKLINQNLNRLDSYLSLIVSQYQKPSKTTLYWFHYTCGAVGLSLCSMWLLRHSRLMGSSDIDNWISDAKESTVVFLKDHVQEPLISIRDELFETFKKRQKGVMELQEVKLTSESLHRMLLAFTEQAGKKFPENAADQEMLEIVMARYEEELMNPIRSIVGGELVRALLIQIQKLKLDIEMAMLELDQILRANEINFAVLAALPALFLSCGLIYIVRMWLKHDKGVEGQGRIARIQRRLLVVEVEKRIMHFQDCMEQGQIEKAETMFGFILYSLDRLYKAVERHAKETGEWPSLKQDILDLGNFKLSSDRKMRIISRLDRVYDCLLPSTKQR